MEESTPPAQMDFSKSLFWIQVRDLPLCCMNNEVGLKIGESIGKVEEVDINGVGTGRGSSLRIRVHLDITKPLERGRALWINGKMVWVNFRYEKLPHFCFNCGRIFHNQTQCSDSKSTKQNAESSPKQWGTWLRAEDMRTTQGSFWRGSRRARSPFRSEAVNQRAGATGGDAASASLSGGREVSPDLLSANTNKVIGAHSFGNSNEKQILLTKLGKEAWDTKAAEIGQHQSHNRRCDFMNLMHPRELLAKDVYPSVTEENTAKTIEGILLEDFTGGPKQDGPISGPSEGDQINFLMRTSLFWR